MKAINSTTSSYLHKMTDIITETTLVSATLAAPASKKFTSAEVATHNSPASLYLTVYEKVYDMTDFQYTHPGGQKSKSLLYARTGIG